MPRLIRCRWCGSDPDYIAYHDQEWGVPVTDDQKLFELLMLEGAQAGLSWITILKKRQRYREVFNNFDPHLIALMTDAELNQLLTDPGIVRNRLKVFGVRKNALAYLEHFAKPGSFSNFIWSFVDYRPIINHVETEQQLNSDTAVSQALSKQLKAKGFTFVGSTICYAFMQAAGLVNDHVVGCFRFKQIQ